MWLMTKYGFFSIGCAWKTETDNTPHPDLMMIRARSKAHLVNLQDRFKAFGKYAITETQDTDYPCRIIASKSDIANMLSQLLEEIDYCNFKDEVPNTLPNDARYHHFLLRVWSEGLYLQNK